jgi:DNA-binding beta-propeller fold protein YncE
MLGRARAAVFVLAAAASALDAATAAAQKMYWADPGGGRLRRSNLDGTQVEDVVRNSVTSPTNITLDPAHGRVYWVDHPSGLARPFPSGTARRARLDGSEVEDLVDSQILNALVLDPAGGHMYWIGWTDAFTIRRAGLDGSNVQALVPIEPQVRAGLTLDLARGRIYWNEGNRVRRANLDGSGVQDLVQVGDGLHSTVALDVVAGKMYWAAGSPWRIERASLDGTNLEPLVLTSSVEPPWEIALDLAAGKMYWLTDATISRANLDGSAVEVVVTGVSAAGQLTLDPTAGKMYWADGATIRRANLDGTDAQTLVAGLQRPDRVAVNAADGKLYWADAQAGKIQRSDPAGTSVEDLASRVLWSPWGIAVDRRAGRLYWTDRENIRRARLDGSQVEAIVSAQEANAIALDLASEKLYWTDAGDGWPGRGTLRRANLDGTDVEDVVRGLDAPRHIALDLPRRRVYWSEPSAGSRIRRASLDAPSSEPELVLETGDVVNAIAVDPVGARLYWSMGYFESVHASIRRANLDGSDVLTIHSGFINGLVLDLDARQMYYSELLTVPFSARIARRDLAGSAEPEILVADAIPPQLALDLPPQPFAGTGFVLEPAALGFDRFAHVSPSDGRVEGIGAVSSRGSATKDVATDPTTGKVYTVDYTASADGQQVYVVDPATGRGTRLPSTTGLPSHLLIWGLAFDAEGTLFGGGTGVFVIDKASGRARPLASQSAVPALIFGMASAPGGVGFLSTGVLLLAQPAVPYAAWHSASGRFVPGAVFATRDPTGRGRLLFDIALSASGFLYGTTLSPPPQEAHLSPSLPVLGSQDLVLLDLASVEGRLVATMSAGAPFAGAFLLGLGEIPP